MCSIYIFLIFLHSLHLLRCISIVPWRSALPQRSTIGSPILSSNRNDTVLAIVASTRPVQDPLTNFQTMTAGALSRTLAQTIMHPANTYKTLLQLKNNGKSLNLTPERLLRGADAQFIMSLPHGAFYFYVIDVVKQKVLNFLPSRLDFLADFTSSTISTIVCSVVSTPQMVITDRIMAGVYPSFQSALKTILSTEGPAGFYAGWWPALAQKIPSYGLTWMFFQQLKRAHEDYMGTAPNAEANFFLGAAAAAAAVCVMIPLDTVKTRLVTQVNGPMAYKGMRDCFVRVMKEEGVWAFYRSLPPRLMSVVPMIAIQFGIYEQLKKNFERLNFEQRKEKMRQAAVAAKARAASGWRERRKSVPATILPFKAVAYAGGFCLNEGFSSCDNWVDAEDGAEWIDEHESFGGADDHDSC